MFDLERAMELSAVLRLIEKKSSSFNNDVVIQTNGFIFGNSDKCLKIAERLADLSLDVLVEISLKGTNSDEFKLLTSLHACMHRHHIGYRLENSQDFSPVNLCPSNQKQSKVPRFGQQTAPLSQS